MIQGPLRGGGETKSGIAGTALMLLSRLSGALRLACDPCASAFVPTDEIHIPSAPTAETPGWRWAASMNSGDIWMR